jgi:O-antigen/teichoic acid export membrane protein
MLWLSVLPLVVNALSTLASFVIIPGLGDLGWGIWSTALGLSGATSFIVSLGIRPLFIRAMARSADRAEQNRLIGNQLAIRVALALVAGTLSLGVGVLVGYGPVTLLCAAIAAAGLVPTVMWTVYSDVLNAREEFRASAFATFWSGILLTATSVVVVLLGYGPVAVAGAYLVGPSFTAVQLGLRLRHRGFTIRPRFRPAELRALAAEARVTATGDGFGALVTRLSGVYIPAIVGELRYGFFTSGTLLTTRLPIVGDAVVTAYNPDLAREGAVLRSGQPTWASRTLLRLLLVAGAILGVGALAVSGWFVAMLYRGEDKVAVRQAVMLVMAIVSGALPFSVIAMGWRQLLIAVDLHDRAAKTAAFASMVGALAAIALTWVHGITGAAIGVVVAAVASAGSLGVVAHRAIGRAAAVPGWRGGALAWALGMSVALLSAREGATLKGLLLGGAAPLVTLAGFALAGLLTREELALLASKIAPRRRA